MINKLTNKINIFDIFNSQLKTLNSCFDYILFFVLPILISIIIQIPQISSFIKDESHELIKIINPGILSTIFSVFSALLLTFLIHLGQFLEGLSPDTNNIKLLKRAEYVIEIMTNSAFGILVGIVNLCLILFLTFPSNYLECNVYAWVYIALTFSILSLTIVFILTILMVLRRIHLFYTAIFKQTI